MKHKYLIAIALLIDAVAYTAGYGQRNPQFSQFAINNYLINPAITGIEPYGDFRLGYRSQWNGVDGAPKTFYASFHSPLGGSNPSQPYNPVNPNARKSISSYSNNYSVYSHHGLGAFAYADKIGAFSRTQVQVSYAYHQALTKKSGLAAGMFAGINQYRIDPDKLDFLDQSDAVLTDDNISRVSPTLSLGLWYYSRNYYIGASLMDVIKKDFDKNYIPNSDLQNQHYLLTSGVKFRVNREFSISGSVLLKWYDEPTPTVDVAVIGNIMDRLMIGGSLRNLNEFILITRIVASKHLDFGYSYDFGYNNFNSFSSGSHEIFVGFKFFNKLGLLCPQHFW